MSDDKGYLLPEGDIDGYPLICVTMKIPDTPEYRRDFIGHMWLLGKWWTWQHGTRGDTRATRAAEYWRGLLFDWFKLEDCPMDCCDDILAQLTALQQGFLDQNALNLTNQVTASDIASQGLRDALEERYDGTPTSINPSAPTTDFGASGDRYDALCAGLTAFVYGFARIQTDHLRIAQGGGLIAIALVAALLIPGLNFFLLVGASVAVLLGLGVVGVTTETAVAALTDHDALGHVICCMRDYLKSMSVNVTNWNACLDGCGFESGSHEQIISDFIRPTLGQNYLTILNILGQAYNGVLDGEELPECPCLPPPEAQLTLTTNPGWGHWVPTFIGMDSSGYEIWEIVRMVNTGYGTALITDPHHSFKFMSEEFLVGGWTAQVAYTTYPGGVWTENFSNHIPDNVEMDTFMRVVDSGALNVWRVHLLYVGAH